MVFVIDDLEGPVDEIIYNGLVAASKKGFASVTLPAVRMGVMLGKVEKTPVETVRKIGEGLNRFIDDYGETTTIKKVTFVVYNDPNAQKALSVLESPKQLTAQ